MSILAAYAVPHPPLIIPAIGRGDERVIQNTIDAFTQVAHEVVELNPELLIITSPHAPYFRDAFHVTTDAYLYGDMARFQAFHEKMQACVDVDFAHDLVQRLNDTGIFAIGSEQYRDAMDHATYVALYFMRQAYREAGSSQVPLCPIARVGLSGFSYEAHRQVGRAIAQSVEVSGKRAVFIGSGDLSHKLRPEGPYGFAPEGPEFDRQIGDIFSSGKLELLFEFDPAFADAAAECGLRSFQMMAGAIEDLGFASELLSLEGPFGVGYGVAAFRAKMNTASKAMFK